MLASLISEGKFEAILSRLLPLFPQAYRYIAASDLDAIWPAIRARYAGSGRDAPTRPDPSFLATVMGEDPVELASEIDSDPFKTLIRTILSARSKDEQTIKVSNILFEHYDTAAALANAPEDHVKEIIKPIGFYNAKTKSIMATARLLLERHGGTVPADLQQLCALPGVGPKVAKCVLVYAFGVPAIPVDTHVHRIVNRWGLVETTDAEKTNAILESLLPERYWLVINDLLVRFGKQVCKPITPDCAACPLEVMCPKIVVKPAPRAPGAGRKNEKGKGKEPARARKARAINPARTA